MMYKYEINKKTRYSMYAFLFKNNVPTFNFLGVLLSIGR